MIIGLLDNGNGFVANLEEIVKANIQHFRAACNEEVVLEIHRAQNPAPTRRIVVEGGKTAIATTRWFCLNDLLYGLPAEVRQAILSVMPAK